MPPLPSVPEVIRFTVEGLCGGVPWVNVLHFSYIGELPDSVVLAGFASTLLSAWSDVFVTYMDTASSVEKVTAVDLSSPLGAAGESATHHPGTSIGAMLPASSAVLVLKSVGRRYRGGRPSTYLCAGVQADLETPSTWQDAFTAEITAAYEDFTGGINGIDDTGTTLGAEVMVSYTSKTANPVAPHRRAVPLVLNVEAVEASPAVAVRRRRLGR